jgi:hypothetical protein
MSYPSQLNYNTTFSQNLSNVMKNLKNKNIIYSVQYISNEDTQIDQDGPQSYWNINLLCVEKTEDDYIFHLNYSNETHGYSYPYFKVMNDFKLYSKKLSDLKNDFDIIFNKEYNVDVGHFIKIWNEDYCYALNTDDKDLTSELMSLSVKMMEIESEYEKECYIQMAKHDKEREEYRQSEEYKKFLQDEKERKEKEEADYRQKEEERLKYCIEKYGEVEGRRWHSRL